MLDQSFSAENFRKILDFENRKGLFLEDRFFPSTKGVIENIRKINTDIKSKKNILSSEDFIKFLEEANESKTLLRQEKERIIEYELGLLSVNASDSKFNVLITAGDTINGKPVYVAEEKAENYFALKQIQYNFRKLYKVKQSNRFIIISQIKNILNDNFPKIVIRTDIKDFYESIPHDKLIQKLNTESLLSFSSKRIIRQIINQYKALAGVAKGIPRGIGISAYLSELYMREIDNIIQALPQVTYYARYVDDIIIVFTPSSINSQLTYLKEIAFLVESKFCLELNQNKTKEFSLTGPTYSCAFEYLGYSIKKTSGNNPVKISLSKDKIIRYKKRIDLVIDSYLEFSKVNEKKARQIFVKRIRFLTGNTRLLNSKKNILVGIYYSHSLSNDLTIFKGLDNYLNHKLTSKIHSHSLLERLEKYKFSDGFELKRFSAFTTRDLSRITEVWN